jgi:putative SOS response-associated peptidase YedK
MLAPFYLLAPQRHQVPTRRMPMNPESVQRKERGSGMCGRFALFASGEEIAERFRLADAPALPMRYNVAPTQQIAAVRATEGGRSLALLRWGLIPSWSSDLSIGNKLLNARSETVAEKPAFRSAFRSRRCLIPVSCFYE